MDENINVALDVMERCSIRWPGTQSASQLYAVLGRACLHSYGTNDDPLDSLSGALTSPLVTEHESPALSESSLPTTMSSNSSAFAQNQQRPMFTQNVFGFKPDPGQDSMHVFNYEDNMFQQPTFRSNSIFKNPTSEYGGQGRRPSVGYFAPEQPLPGATSLGPPPTTPRHPNMQLPTPPESNTTGSHSFSPPPHMSPGTTGSPTPKLAYSNAMPVGSGQQQQVPPSLKYEHEDPPETPISHAGSQHQQTPTQASHRTPIFTVPTHQPQHVVTDNQRQPLQRPLPPSDWLTPSFNLPFAYNGGSSTNDFWNESAVSNAAFAGLMGGGAYPGPSNQPTSVPSQGGGYGNGGYGNGMPPGGFGFPGERHGSLSADQQVELMGILETDGLGEINNYLGMDMNNIF